MLPHPAADRLLVAVCVVTVVGPRSAEAGSGTRIWPGPDVRYAKWVSPNGGGLNTLQIADAIRSVGLEAFGIGVSSVPRVGIPTEDFANAAPPVPALDDADARAAQMQLELKLAVFAYLRSGIACALLSRTIAALEGRFPPAPASQALAS